jgi:hypothetical protein
MSIRRVLAHGKWVEVDVVNPPNAKKTRRRRNDTFVQVPLALAAAITKATNTPKAMVGIMVLYEAWVNKGKPFTLSDKKLTGFGVKRNTRRRALDAMEAAGLVTVEWKNGRAPVVTLVEPAQP